MTSSPEPLPQELRTLTRLRFCFWALGIAIAAWQAIVYRNWVNGDAISYLDMSDAVLTGDWGRLSNGSWSPLYPALVGLAFAVLRPSAAWQFPVVHLVNFLCFVLSFACFEYLLRGMVTALSFPQNEDVEPLPRWAVLSLGYSLFLWGTLGLVTLMKPTPDMLMSAFLFLSLGVAIRIKNGQNGLRMYAALGAALALGYLAKTIMLPLGLITLASSLFVGGKIRKGLSGAAMAVVVFALLITPQIVGLSRAAGRFSFGDAGSFEHLVFIDKIDIYEGKLGGASGTFAHSPTKIFDNPVAYSYERPFSATSHFWYDPPYWVAGVRPGSDLRRQARVIIDSLNVYGGVARRLGVALAALAILCFLVGAKGTLRATRMFWPLWLVAVMALGAYATLHVEERYLGALLTLLGASVFCAFGIPRTVPARTVQGLVAAIILNLAFFTAQQMHRDHNEENVSKINIGDAEAAMALQKLGTRPGDHVARINPKVADGWARLAKVEIIAEVRRSSTEKFWKATPDTQQAVLHAFAAAGAKAVVAYSYPRRDTLPAGWTRLGNTNYAAFILQ